MQMQMQQAGMFAAAAANAVGAAAGTRGVKRSFGENGASGGGKKNVSLGL